MIGEFPPGTVVEPMGSVFASASDGEATKSAWLSRVRLRPSGQVINIQYGVDTETQFVTSNEQGVIRGGGPALQDTIRFYLASRDGVCTAICQRSPLGQCSETARRNW